MLLVGRYQKEVNLKVNPLRYENNNSFTKLIHTPIRDSSFPAVQRAKSAFQKRCGLGLEKKVKKLDSFKAEVLREKQQFAEFEKYKNFYEKVDKIVEKRKKSEEKAAVMIQSAFKGFSSRKIYLEVTYNQKRIEIDREVTKKLLAEMQRYSENCFTVLVGNSVIPN